MQSKTTTFSLIALCALLGALLIWRLAAGDPEKKSFEARIAVLTQQLAAARQAAAPTPPVFEPPQENRTAVAPPKALPGPPQHVSAAPAIAQLNEDLAAARSRISELESKILGLEADRATLTQQRQQELTASEETCRTRIADTQRSLETAQIDLKSAQQKAALFESENENLRKSQASAVKVAARAIPPEGALDELSRRRDGYLKSLIRRYREIDNDYRAFMRDAQASRASDPAMLRIQATLSQAEEDLRQIDSLNAKTLLVEKRREKN
jgi:hypothetical protein